MTIKENKHISISSVILNKEISEEEAKELLENLEKQNKIKKVWLIVHKNLLEQTEADTEKEIDEVFERLESKGIKTDDYFIKNCIYKVLEDITI